MGSVTVLIGFFLKMLTKTLHIALERFVRRLTGPDTDTSVSKQAGGKARKTLSDQAFMRLKDRVRTALYPDNTSTT